MNNNRNFRGCRPSIFVLLAAVTALVSLGSPAAAQDTQVSAAFSSDTVGIQDQFQLTVTVSGKDSSEAEVPRLPTLQGFHIVAGPSVGTQFQWINGRTSNSKSFTYILLPEKTGQFTLDPVEVRVGGKILKSQPITITVTNAPPQPRTPRSPFPSPFSDEDTAPRRSRITGEDVFITAELDRTSAYPGQQVTLSYHLYTQVSVTGLQLQESPSLTGFWVEDIKVDPNPTPTRKVVGGREYLEYVVKRQALFPNAPGELKIPPATFAISARTAGDFFGVFGQSETLYRKTKDVTLEVRPLPAQGKPAHFENAVGSFNLTASLSKTEVAAGDAVTLYVKLSGRGNLKMIPDLELPPMADFTIYSSKRAEEVRPFEGNLIGGEKSWEYVIVPKAPGSQSVPSLSLSYFDPAHETYHTIATPALALNVIRGANAAGGITELSGISRQNLRRQGTDINFIKLSADGLKADRAPYGTVWFYLIAFIAVAFNVGAFLYQRETAMRSRNAGLFRSRKARRTALQRLKMAEKAGRTGSRSFYDEAANAFAGYLSDKFGLPEIALAADTLERALVEKNVSGEAIGEAVACLRECDFGRFAAADAVPEQMRELARRIREAIDDLERI